jgi:hypothetical protein
VEIIFTLVPYGCPLLGCTIKPKLGFRHQYKGEKVFDRSIKMWIHYNKRKWKGKKMGKSRNQP